MILKPLLAATAAAGVLLTAAPAQASDTGLYGAGDATYDGVYRQSLAILSLKASGQKIYFAGDTALFSRTTASAS